MAPSTFLGFALFVAFIIPGYMWVRVEERVRPRPDRSQLLEVAELVAVGALASTLAGGVTALLGSPLRPLLNVYRWSNSPDPSAFLQANVLRAVASLLLAVVLANAGTKTVAEWRFSERGELQLAKLRSRLRMYRRPHRLRIGNTVWYEVLGKVNKETEAALLTVVQDDGTMLTGWISSYDYTARGAEQDLALQQPITWRPPRGPAHDLERVSYVIVPAQTLRSAFIAVVPRPKGMGTSTT